MHEQDSLSNEMLKICLAQCEHFMLNRHLTAGSVHLGDVVMLASQTPETSSNCISYIVSVDEHDLASYKNAPRIRDGLRSARAAVHCFAT